MTASGRLLFRSTHHQHHSDHDIHHHHRPRDKQQKLRR
jgi:hypothetical protein